jgi:hypothetical protein
LLLVQRSAGAALGAGAVVGQRDDERIVETAERRQASQQPSDLHIRVIEQPGVGFLESREYPALVRR